MTGDASTIGRMARRRNQHGPDLDIVDPANERAKPCRRCGHATWNLEEHVPFGIQSLRYRTFRLRCGNPACGFVLVTARLQVDPYASGMAQPRQRLVPARQLPRHRRP